MYDFISIGEMLIDFTPCGVSEGGAPLYQPNPGGAPANAACVMAKLGRKAAFIGKVGADVFGASCKKALEDAGCDSRYLVFSETLGTTLAFVTLSPDGNRDFSFYRNHTTADVSLSPADIPAEAYGGAKIFHFGSVSLTQNPSRSTVLAAVKRAKGQGALISYDPNYRVPLWRSPKQAKAAILEGLPLCDMLKISDEEQRFLFDDLPEDAVGELLHSQYGIALAVITKAKNGCTAYLNGKRYDSPAYDVKTVDTTGAGDSFWAGLLLRLLESGKQLDMLSDSEVAGMLQFANAVGSLVTAKKGAIAAVPSREEIEACIREGKVL
ncbi:MAG: carbohydrate kinase [Oscillospiraceae bacterium]|nr:carbohydrate kinase [Oscillospiraceae bacterium]